jgi:flagellar biosynthetic protein FliS
MAEPQLHLTASNSPISRHSGSPSRSVAALDSGIPVQYELLLRKLASAERELESGDLRGRSGNLEEASGIVFDLLYSLDFKNGGELVPRLAALYGYIGNELLNVGRTGDRAQLAHLRDMIATLRQSWSG